jgi:hypothetical protein
MAMDTKIKIFPKIALTAVTDFIKFKKIMANKNNICFLA